MKRNRLNIFDNTILSDKWQSITIPAFNLAIGTTAPTVNTVEAVRYYEFAGGVEGTADELYGGFQLMPDYKLGTTTYISIHWFPTTATTAGEDIVFGFDSTRARIGDVFGEYTASTTTLIAGAVRADHVHTVSTVFTIDGTDATLGANMFFRFYRPRIETNLYSEPIGLTSIEIHYEVDSIGSSGINIK